jgi:hypothetical protein
MTIGTCLAALAFSVFIDARQGGTGQTMLRSVRFDPEPDGVAMTIEANGPLPLPRVGVLADPPRVYIDLAGVAPGTSAIVESFNALVRRVRVAVNQPDPLVTRVVIDLSQPVAHRVDASARAAGRIRVLLGGRAASDVRPAASVPPNPPVSVLRKPDESVPPTPAERPPTLAARQRSSPALAAAAARLEVLRPLLTSIDTRADVPEPSLRAALAEFAAIQHTLTGLRASEVQDALVKVCVLGTTAVEARIDAQLRGEPGPAWTAASAAAGALMTLDRASKPTR